MDVFKQHTRMRERNSMFQIKNLNVNRGGKKFKVKSIIVVKLYFILMNVYCCIALCLFKVIAPKCPYRFYVPRQWHARVWPLVQIFAACCNWVRSYGSLSLRRRRHSDPGNPDQVLLELQRGSSMPSQRELDPYKVTRSHFIALSPVSLQGFGGLENGFFNIHPYIRMSFQQTSNWATVHYGAQNP